MSWAPTDPRDTSPETTSSSPSDAGAPLDVARPMVGVDDLARFHETLASLCRSELPLPKALALLSEELRSGKLRDATEDLAAQVERGVPLAEAYRAHADALPPMYGTLVEAGVASGDLPGTLEDIARHADHHALLRERLRRALAAPIATACCILITGVCVFAFLKPMTQRLTVASSPINTLSTMAGDASPSSSPAIAAAAFALLGAAILAVLHFMRDPLSERASGWRLPVLGRLQHLASEARFASTLGLLLRRELPLAPALELTAATSPSASERDRIQAMAEQARQGAGVTDCLRNSGVWDESRLWLVRAAEQSGHPEHALDDVAAMQVRRLDRSVERFTTWTVPLLQLLTGFAVLAVAMHYAVPGFADFQHVFRW